MLRLAQQKEREGAGTPGGCTRRPSPAKGWAKTGQMAPPPGKKSKGEERVREKGKVEETERGAELQALSGKVPRNRGGDELGSPLMVALLREQGGSF